MPILNYTTKIPAFQTVGEIQGILAKHGAKRMMIEYDAEGEPQSIVFEILTPYGSRGIRLPSNYNAVFAVLKKQKVKCDIEQAKKVAWRIVKDWVAAQMAILEAEMVSMDEIFLPYMVDKSGQTLYENYLNNQLLLEG